MSTNINQCLTNIFKNLTNINQYLTDTENQFYKISVVLVKYCLSIGLYWRYGLNIDLILVKLSSTLEVFYQYLTDTKQFTLETNSIGKISQVSVKNQFIQFSILGRFDQYLTVILKTNIIGYIS